VAVTKAVMRNHEGCVMRSVKQMGLPFKLSTRCLQSVFQMSHTIMIHAVYRSKWSNEYDDAI